MNQPKWQRQVVGATAMAVGMGLCILGGFCAFDIWQSRGVTPSTITIDILVSGVCGTLGVTMIGIGLYDGFLSHTTSVNAQHNGFLKTAIWLAIATFGGFLLWVFGNLFLQPWAGWR